MRNIPRILPLAGIAVGGVLAINALSGAEALPQLLSGARASAEEAARPEKPGKAAKGEKPGKAKAGEEAAQAADTGEAKGAAARIGALTPGGKPAPVCAPTAAELAKEAGLSPAELQVLQSLGARRGQLDKREEQLDVQLALLAAAEAKLDLKVKALNSLKGDITALLAQADTKDQGEIDRLVKVFEGMKPKDSAPRMVLLDDAVRLPIAAKMKERSLSAILAVMPPAEAKRLTEALARRFSAAKALAAQANSQANAPSAPAAAAAAAPKPKAATPRAAPKPKAQAANAAPADAAKPSAEPQAKAG